MGRLAQHDSAVAVARVTRSRRSLTNPLVGLSPAALKRARAAWDAGEIKGAAHLYESMLSVDDQLIAVDGKRRRAIAARQWEILTINSSAEARAQKAKLERFYNNLTAVSAWDENKRGGVRVLIGQMMQAPALEYSVHEIVWHPDAALGLTAEFRSIPLQFFENTTGRLRYLKNDQDQVGIDMDTIFGADRWMVTSSDGPGLMRAGSVAYLLKTRPLLAAASYVEKFGIPPLHGKTTANKGSPEWNDLVDAIQNFGEDLALVTNESASIAAIELENLANMPHLELIDRMDRAISRIWLGGDLATMSADGGAVGSRAQSRDLANLVISDCAMISDALQEFVDGPVIRYNFGERAAPLAYFKLLPPALSTVANDLLIDQFLITHGVPQSIADLRERYGRPEPEPGEELTRPVLPAAAPLGGLPAGRIPTVAAPASFNGAQVRALTELVNQVSRGLLPIETARSTAQAAFPALTPEALERVFEPLRSVGNANDFRAVNPLGSRGLPMGDRMLGNSRSVATKTGMGTPPKASPSPISLK